MILKSVYVVVSAVYQIVMIAGGAWLTFSGGSGWWVTGGILLAIIASVALTQRMNHWTGKCTD